MLALLRKTWWIVWSNWLTACHYAKVMAARWENPAVAEQHRLQSGCDYVLDPLTGHKLTNIHCLDCGANLEKPK